MVSPSSVRPGFFALLVVLCAGCTDDGAAEHVDYITFRRAGTYREKFLDIAFWAGEVAFDVLADNPSRAWMMGPGSTSNYVPGTDADVAPYPNIMLPRKTTPDGRLDKRYWTAFAGGSWSSVGILVEPRLKFRASPDPPHIYPATMFVWQPQDKGEMSWPSAVLSEEVICWAFSSTGTAHKVSKGSCVFYHPRSHWSVDECDDCPLPAITYPAE